MKNKAFALFLFLFKKVNQVFQINYEKLIYEIV